MGKDPTPAAREGLQRLEAFSDGVIAIIVTIMVLELKLPDQLLHANRSFNIWTELFVPLAPNLIAYVLSFFVVAVMWLNHKSLVDNLTRTSHGVVVINMVLLFFMSLIPFVTHLVGETRAQAPGVALYGALLLACSLAFAAMRRQVTRQTTEAVLLARQRRLRLRSRVGIVIYIVAIPLAFVSPWLALAAYAFVPMLFFLPQLLGGEGAG